MYSLVRKALFCLNPETSHDLSLDCLGAAERLGVMKLAGKTAVADPVEVMGLSFPNRVGLAAGLDKNGDFFNALGHLGFGFIEIGTITPKPQPGNPQPRMFRLPEKQAIINRMGFNNKGVAHLVEQVKQRRFNGVLGINIGKNKNTSAEESLNDYLLCMRAVYEYADYITVNISSPNTPGLRDLQFGESLSQLLSGLKAEQAVLAEQVGRYVPLAVKIAPDMSDDEIRDVANILKTEQLDAVIATNTTVERDAVNDIEHGDEQGGLSGAPVFEQSTHVVAVLAQALNGALPIIGVGGIVCADDAVAKIQAGASLVQVYSGFIYEGPQLVEAAAAAIKATISEG